MEYYGKYSLYARLLQQLGVPNPRDLSCIGGAGLSNTNKDYSSLRASTGRATEPPPSPIISDWDSTIQPVGSITITIAPENL